MRDQNYYGSVKVQKMEEFHLGGEHFATIQIVVPRKHVTEQPRLVLLAAQTGADSDVNKAIDLPVKVEDEVVQNPEVPVVTEEVLTNSSESTPTVQSETAPESSVDDVAKVEIQETGTFAAEPSNSDDIDFMKEIGAEESTEEEEGDIIIAKKKGNEIKLGVMDSAFFNQELEANGFDIEGVKLVLDGKQKTHKGHTFEISK